MRRVIVYIDGFNLYHAIDALHKPWLKWVDLNAIGLSLLRQGEILKTVKYFSAYATWMPQRYARHRDYVSAIAAHGAIPHMAKFKAKPRKCLSCQSTWIGHEEKETDVQIAVHMVCDALRGEAERLIVISADTDLSPAIAAIAKLAPQCEVFVASPPGRFAKGRGLKPGIEITAGRLNRCLLPEKISMGGGRVVSRPPSYAPPT